MAQQFYFFPREPYQGNPGGITVSKNPELPEGDFQITEYSWGRRSLWFIDGDRFTGRERAMAYREASEISYLHGFT